MRGALTGSVVLGFGPVAFTPAVQGTGPEALAALRFAADGAHPDFEILSHDPEEFERVADAAHLTAALLREARYPQAPASTASIPVPQADAGGVEPPAQTPPAPRGERVCARCQHSQGNHVFTTDGCTAYDFPLAEGQPTACVCKAFEATSCAGATRAWLARWDGSAWQVLGEGALAYPGECGEPRLLKPVPADAVVLPATDPATGEPWDWKLLRVIADAGVPPHTALRYRAIADAIEEAQR